MTSRDPDNEAFERYLAGDDELAAGYANAATEAPDALLDAQVRKAARATAKRATEASSPWSGTFRNHAALAAVVVVTVGLLASLSLNQTEYRSPAPPHSDHTADDRVQSTAQEGRQERAPSPLAESSRSNEPHAGRSPQPEMAPLFSIDAPRASAPQIVAPDSQAGHRPKVDTKRMKPSKTFEQPDELLSEIPAAAAATNSSADAAEADAKYAIDAESTYAKPPLLREQRRELRWERPAAESPPDLMAAAPPMREQAILELRAIRKLLESGDVDAAQARWRAFQSDYPQFPALGIERVLEDYRDLLDSNPKAE